MPLESREIAPGLHSEVYWFDFQRDTQLTAAIENLSLKNLLWVVFSVVGGYFVGQIVGGLLGTIVWAFVGVVFGGLVYQATNTIIISTILSIAFGVLLAFLIWGFDKRLFGARTPFLIWGLAGAIAGLIVMFTYGINIISHPELYGNFNGLNPLNGYIFDINRYYNPAPQPWRLPVMQYGGGTGKRAVYVSRSRGSGS
jgi:hypothetical protein